MRGKRFVLVVLALVVGGAVSVAAAQGLKPATKMTDDLAALHEQHLAASAARVPLDMTDSILPVDGDFVTVDATAAGDPNVLAVDLHALGALDIAVSGWRVSARLPIAALPSLETLPSLRFLWPAYSASNVGAVTSQGDVAMRADIARNHFGLNGAGVTVGVLSDSFDCLGGAAGGVASGDLPTVTVVQEASGSACTNGTDEGRAMLEIVHDVAPGASLAFATANGGQANFANNIRKLRDVAGAKVIVDDIFYFAEPMFQDGVIAQAVNDVVGTGVSYFSAAGNDGRLGFASTFVPGTVYAPADARLGGTSVFLGGTAHDFGGTPLQSFSIPAGTSLTMTLQWDAPFAGVSGPPGNTTDLDVYVTNAQKTAVIFGAKTDNIAAGDPVEILTVNCNAAVTCTGAFLIVNHAGPKPGRFKYVLLQASVNVTTTPALNSGTIFGHANAVGAMAVGAASYTKTPAFGTAPPVIESFSSWGTTPVLFGPTGNRLPTPDLRANKPDFVAPDGADTTFFFPGVDSDGDGFPNFFGTSAAAPHAAAVGALMLQAVPTLTPTQIRTALKNTALDMATPGFDNNTGSGLIQADAALAAAGAKVLTTTTLTSSANPAVAGQAVTFTAHVGATVPGQVIPVGSTVNFFDGATKLGSAVLDLGDSGSFTTGALVVGTHTITAQFGGDATNAASTSSPLTETIAKADSTTVVTGPLNPAIFGHPVTFTAAVSPVAPGTKTPTGAVVFIVDGAAPAGPPATLNATGQATLTTNTLTVGNPTITAQYVGDANENPSSGTVTQTIMPAPSSTVITASPNPSTFGRAVTLTATVKPLAPSTGTATGSVLFADGVVPLGVAPLSPTGQATLTTSALTAGTHTIVADYSADLSVLPSTSTPLTLMVAKAATTTTLTSSPSPAVTGQPVTLTATVGLVAPSTGVVTGSVTGSVIFRDGMNVLATVPLIQTGGVGVASFTTALAAGTRSLTASFSGDANTNPSASPARTQTVSKASTSITLTTSTNAAVVGQSVSFTATLSVVAPGAGTPTGGVVFLNGAVALGTVTPTAAGVATFTTTALTLGPHAITARYVGDTSFSTSTTSPALTVTITEAATNTVVTASANPAAWHQPVTLTAAVSVVAPGSGTPTGIVTFFNGPPPALGTAPLNAGRAALTTSALTVGDHAITASYAGAATFNGSVSTVFTATVVPAPSATTLTASPNPAVTGRPVLLTATVAVRPPATGTPTGTVTFFDGPTPLGNRILSAGKATLTTGILAVGPHALTAGYLGDGNVAPSTSSAVAETISQATTTTSLTSSANPSVTGRAVTFTAKVSVVAPGAGTPTGSVTFMDGATPLATVMLDATRQATLTTSALAVGAHSITAVYGGDAGFVTSKSPLLTETIGKAATKTALVSSGTPVVHGVPVTFTATVTVVAPGAGTPTGTVTFLDGATPLGTVALNAMGQASLTTGGLVAGARAITVRYAGDGSFAPSASAVLSEMVTKASTLAALVTSTSTAVAGQPVVLTATVIVVAPGAGTPTGMVTFLNGPATLGTAALNAAGQAMLATSTLTLGAHTITARYVGDASFLTSTSSAFTVTVAKAATAATVSASASPAVLHQVVTFTAAVSVTPPGSGAPTGAVTFFDGSLALGTGALNTTGRATFTTSALKLGDHAITAGYSGAASFNGSVSTVFTETITPATSATTLTAAPNPAVVGRGVLLTATVGVVSPGSGAATGTVTFLDEARALGNGTLSAGKAMLTTTDLGVGPHVLTARYLGDGNVAPSTSSIVTGTISRGSTTTTLTASANPAAVGQMVTLTATVNVVAPAAGLPTGNVAFMEGLTTLGTATLDATRKATLTTSALALGSHAITAGYVGDASFAPSVSMSLIEKISSLPPSITSDNTATFAPGKAGQSFTVTATGMPTNTITRTGLLPSGVTFKDNGDNTATIAGTPAAGTQTPSPYPWVITAANGTPPNAVQNPFTFRVVCPTIGVSGTIPALTFDTAMPAAAFTQMGGNGTITWSASGLPTGVAIDPVSGQVAGKPEAAGTFATTITATDAGACTGSAQQSVTVAPLAPPAATYDGLVDNTQFVVTGGATASPATPFVGGAVRLGGTLVPGVSVTAGTLATTGGGSVTIAADGTFVYTPKANPGATATTTDSFAYTVVSNAGAGGGAGLTSAPATVSLTLAGRVWYVKNNGAAGTGQSPSPFNALSAAVAASTPADTIFVYQGSGTTTNLATVSTLKAGQQLVGEGAGLAVNGQPLVAAGGFPLLGNTVKLASGVTVAGLDLGTGPATGLSGATVTGVTVVVRDVTTTTGTAVNISGAGNSGTFTFRKISASGGANGIVLQNLTGSFTVNGDGANTTVGGNASGGTIANMIGADPGDQTSPFAGVGVYLNNVQNVTLRRMTINGANQNYGIRGFAVDGFTLEYATVSGVNGTAPTLAAPEEAGEGSIYFGNATTSGLSTSGTFTGNVIQGGRARNLSIINTTAGVTTLTLKGNTFGANQNLPDADDSVAVEARNGGTSISAIVGGTNAGEPNTFTGAPGELVSFTGQTGTTMDVVFHNNALSNTHAQNLVGGGGMTLATQGTMTFDVDSNSFSGADGSALTLFKASEGALLSGRVNANAIGVSGVADSGSRTGNGIFVVGAGTGTLSVTIANNTILHYDGGGIYADNTDGGYTANFTITGNTTAEPDANALAGLLITNGSPSSGDTVNVCAKITGNDFSAGDPDNSSDVFIGASGAAAGHTFNLPGYVGATTAAVQTFIANANLKPGTTAVSAFTDPGVPVSAFTGTGTSCPTP